MKKAKFFLFSMVLFINLNVFSQNQNEKVAGRGLIDSLLNAEAITAAKKELQSQTNYYFDNQILDSLPSYVKLVGSKTLVNGDWTKALKNAESFIEKIHKTENQIVLKNAYLELANLYDDKGDPDTAYKKALLALELAKKIEDPKKADLEGVYYNLGTKAFNMGDISLSKKHQLKNLALRLKSNDENHEMYYYTYNTMGRLMWFSGQPDSSMYYFRAAIKSAKKLDSTPWNQFYRPALLNGNIAVLLQAKGEVEKAIEVTKEAVDQLQAFDELSVNEADKLTAMKQKLASIDNLGLYYNSVGEFERAERLIGYSLGEKKKQLDAHDINITISMMILGQAKMGTRQFEEAKKHFLEAIERLQTSKNTNTYYLAFTQTSLASTYEALEEYEKAAEYFEKGERTFRKTMKGDYSKDFLDELSDMALFYSKIGNEKKSKALTNEILDFVSNGSFKGSLQHYNMLLTQAEVHYNLEQYEEASRHASDGLQFFKTISGIESKKDSIQIGFRKPKNLLLYTQSSYHLNQNKDEGFYIKIIDSLESALPLLEQRKSVLKTFEDLSGLMSENQEVFSFLTKLYSEVYQLTEDQSYLDDLLSINESGIYSKIRTRLNFKHLSFTNVPQSILSEERKLKNELHTSLDEIAKKGTSHFFETNQKWSSFTDSLKKFHPDYYDLRYASVTESIEGFKKNIDNETTVVRYFYINEVLNVYVADRKKEQLFQLPKKNLKSSLVAISDFRTEDSETFQILNDLYNVLWKPIAENVTTQKVIIFPDRELFNLSFELLTPGKIENYTELTFKSLLSQHDISYNYSLLLLNRKQKVIEFEEDYIAFVPEFDEAMKTNYQMAISDSLYLDKSYLTLLPQPFSSQIAKKFGQKFDGRSFLNQDASKQLFTKNAKEHKIIHIGTHAESNNVSPELSRLVFAKNVSDSVNLNDNYLYTYEIYNQDLSSNLAILTACETGKPTYQPGEGMISLAHAFNYAGSESILTSLWQIDEQSSNQILDYFYTYLEDGLPKDEALRKAKLDYLSKAEGRTLHPQYWAGLILMGDTAPIELSSSPSYLWYLIIALLAATTIFIAFRKKALNKLRAFFN